MATHLQKLDWAITDTLAGVDGIRRLIVTMPPRHGKLIADSTPVLTLSGWKTHGELCVGDFVFGSRGKPIAVIAESATGTADMEVEFCDGSKIKTHANHEWRVFDRSHGKWKTVETRYIASRCRSENADRAGLQIVGFNPDRNLLTCLTGKRLGIRSPIIRRLGIKCVTECQPEAGKCIQVDAADGIYLVGPELIPTHNSELCSKYLPAWYLGTHPDHRVILASYEASFAAEWGRKARTVLEGHGRGVFGIQVAKTPSAADHWDLAGHAGGMQTAGVGGPITGKGANLLIVDDEIKNAEAAASETMRKKAWEWWTSTAYTRLEPEGVAIVIQTRWHQDDLAGKLLADMEQGGERWRVVNFPAISDDGNALWPERYPLDRLREIQRTLGSYQWSALYQQRPTPPEGGKFKREWFPTVPSLPEGARKAVRYWDKAGTEGGGDYSAGCLIVEHKGLYYVADMCRGQWSDLQRENMIQQCAERDRHRFGRITTWVEQEPGSGGKDSAMATIRRLAGHSVWADKVSGDKELRAGPFAAQGEAGNVRLLRGPWNAAYLDEICMFPNGTYDDQVDSSSGAFNKLTTRGRLMVSSGSTSDSAGSGSGRLYRQAGCLAAHPR